MNELRFIDSILALGQPLSHSSGQTHTVMNLHLAIERLRDVLRRQHMALATEFTDQCSLAELVSSHRGAAQSAAGVA